MVVVPTDERLPSPELSTSRKRQAFLFGGSLLTMTLFAHPGYGMIDLPITFFLKNRLHLDASQLAIFKLWVGVPLMIGFIFGFIRDRWSPFGRGDQMLILIFGTATAAIYGAVAISNPKYILLLGAIFIASMTFRMASSAVYGLNSTIARRYAISGQMSGTMSVADGIAYSLSFAIGGVFSQWMDGNSDAGAARTIFFCAACLMLIVVAIARLGPKWIFHESRERTFPTNNWQELKRIGGHWPIYPAILIQVMWQFSPATGTVLQYYIVDHLHASDAQWGLWQGLFGGSAIPAFVAYGFLATRFTLRTLLWLGFTLAIFQMSPLLFVGTPSAALLAAVPIGIIGGIAEAALLDLFIRSAPVASEGMMMLLYWALYYFSVRVGDVLGTRIYELYGGFIPTVVITMIVCGLILPILLFVPSRLTATKDGEAFET